MAEDKEKKRPKKATALKRIQQDKVKQKRNRFWKRRVHTERVRVSKIENTDEKSAAISVLYKVVDKAVKKGVLKQNTAARIKSRLSTR